MVTSSCIARPAGSPALHARHGPKAASKRFDVYAESEPVTLADGQPGGRTFALA